MQIQPTIIPARHRVRRKRRATPSGPLPDSIVSVTHDGTDAVIVETSSVVTNVDGPDALWITADGGGSWIVPTGASLPDDFHVRFTFDVDVTACTAWHVQDAGLWEWQDGGAMNGPFDGGIG